MIATASPIVFITFARRAANSAGVKAVVKIGTSAAIGAWVHASDASTAARIAIRILMGSPPSQQFAPVLSEPPLRFTPPRADRRHLSPEPPRVVRLPDVHQLVKDDVVAHFRGHLNQPPVERDDPLRRASAPARSLI